MSDYETELAATLQQLQSLTGNILLQLEEEGKLVESTWTGPDGKPRKGWRQGGKFASPKGGSGGGQEEALEKAEKIAGPELVAKIREKASAQLDKEESEAKTVIGKAATQLVKLAQSASAKVFDAKLNAMRAVDDAIYDAVDMIDKKGQPLAERLNKDGPFATEFSKKYPEAVSLSQIATREIDKASEKAGTKIKEIQSQAAKIVQEASSKITTAKKNVGRTIEAITTGDPDEIGKAVDKEVEKLTNDFKKAVGDAVGVVNQKIKDADNAIQRVEADTAKAMFDKSVEIQEAWDNSAEGKALKNAPAAAKKAVGDLKARVDGNIQKAATSIDDQVEKMTGKRTQDLLNEIESKFKKPEGEEGGEAKPKKTFAERKKDAQTSFESAKKDIEDKFNAVKESLSKENIDKVVADFKAKLPMQIGSPDVDQQVKQIKEQAAKQVDENSQKALDAAIVDMTKQFKEKMKEMESSEVAASAKVNREAAIASIKRFVEASGSTKPFNRDDYHRNLKDAHHRATVSKLTR